MTPNNRSNQAGFDLLLRNDDLIYGVLKALHVDRKRQNYPDLYQNCILAYIKAYQAYPKEIDDDPHAFLVYAYQAIKWDVLMYFRTENGQNVHVGFTNRTDEDDAVGDYFNQISAPNCDAEQAVIYNELFEQLYHRCNVREQRFLVLRYFDHATLKEIAKDLNITRRTANNIKFKVQEKFSELLVEK